MNNADKGVSRSQNSEYDQFVLKTTYRDEKQSFGWNFYGNKVTVIKRCQTLYILEDHNIREKTHHSFVVNGHDCMDLGSCYD
jgi:hypothetical protein